MAPAHQAGRDPTAIGTSAFYYRGRIDTDAIRALGLSGTVVEPGEWGRLVNGGAWLTVDGLCVDLLYRNLDEVEHCKLTVDRSPAALGLKTRRCQ